MSQNINAKTSRFFTNLSRTDNKTKHIITRYSHNCKTKYNIKLGTPYNYGSFKH